MEAPLRRGLGTFLVVSYEGVWINGYKRKSACCWLPNCLGYCFRCLLKFFLQLDGRSRALIALALCRLKKLIDGQHCANTNRALLFGSFGEAAHSLHVLVGEWVVFGLDGGHELFDELFDFGFRLCESF